MIYESYPWKQDLLKQKKLIQRYNRSEFLGKRGDYPYTVIEKAVFYSAFIIRKLVDCKEKVSDEVDNYMFHIKGIAPQKNKNVDMLHQWPKETSYRWEKEKAYTVHGKDICNWLIHSYVFFFCLGKKGIESFYVSSDFDRNTILYRIALKDWVNYLDFVATDDVVETIMYFSEKERDYVFTKKKRG